LVQSGKPVGVFRTHPGAPRVLIANALLVPRWATWDEFRRLEALGLTMFGQMTAGSWIYIGTQGILQATYQTFAPAAERHCGAGGGSRRGWGLGGEARERRRGRAGAGGARPALRPRHRPDCGARSSERLRAPGPRCRGGGAAAVSESGGVPPPRARVDRPPRR